MKKKSLHCLNMAKVEMLRELMTQRLAAVVEEICGLFETTIADYEENVSHLKKETEQQGRLLNAVLNNGVKLHSAGLYSYVIAHSHCLDQFWVFCFIIQNFNKKQGNKTSVDSKQ